MKLWQATLCISTPGTSVTDDELTADTLERHTMAKASGKFVKALYGDALAPYQKRARIARKDYHRLTFEGIGNIRLVVLDERQAFLDLMATHEAALREEGKIFIAKFDEILAQERADKNGAFRLEDYPSRGSLAERFSVVYQVLPMPDPSQFLKDAMTDGLSERMAAEYAARLENTTRKVSETVLQTMMNLVAETAESLAGDGPIVDSENRKGPFAKLQEYLDRVPALNITNDPKISAVLAQCKERLSFSADRIRANKTTRQLVAAHAQNIALNFGGIQRKIAFKKAA